jgi:hypothetical protein
VTRTEREFTAILAAHDAEASAPEAARREQRRLSGREFYFANPAEVGLDDQIGDVALSHRREVEMRPGHDTTWR